MRRKKYSKEKKQKKDEERLIVEKFRAANKMKNLSEAKTYIDNYSNKLINNPFFQHEVGKYYFNIGRLDKAIKLFEDLVEQNNTNVGYSLFELAKCYQYNFEYSKSTECLQTIINSNHYDKGPAFHMLAKNYVQMNRVDKAIEMFNIEKKKGLKKDAWNASIQLSKLYLLNCEESKAYNEIKQVDISELNESSKYFVQIQLCRVLLKIGRIKDVHEELKKFRFINYRDYNLDITRAMLEYSECDYELTIKRINGIIKNITKHLDILNARILLCCSYRRLHMFEEAKRELEEIKRHNSNILDGDFEIDESKYTLEEALILEGQKEYDMAYELLEKSKNVNCACRGIILIKLGSYYIKNGRLELLPELISDLEKIVLSEDYKKDVDRFKAYANKYLGTCYEVDINSIGSSSILKYDYDVVKEHICAHAKKRDNETYFYEIDNIDEIINNVNEKLITLEPETCSALDVFYVPYENIGVFNGERTNVLKVVATCDEKKIITMFPYKNFAFMNENENKKVMKTTKKLSQIEKFEKRYGGM